MPLAETIKNAIYLMQYLEIELLARDSCIAIDLKELRPFAFAVLLARPAKFKAV
jgi:hypothetical protein